MKKHYLLQICMFLLLPTFSFSQVTFSDPFRSTNDSILSHWAMIKNADINNDGIQDLIKISTSNILSDSIYFYFGLGNGTFAMHNSIKLIKTINPDYDKFLFSDFNNDSKIDFAFRTFNFTNDSLFIYLSSGNGNFNNPIVYSYGGPTSGVNNQVVTDLNNDTFLDIVYFTWDRTYCHFGDGFGNFSNVVVDTTNLANYTKSCFADFNNDNIIDLCVLETSNTSNYSNAKMKIFQGNTSGKFNLSSTIRMIDSLVYPMTLPGNTFLLYPSVVSTDIDNDNDNDILFITTDNNHTYYLNVIDNLGSNNFHLKYSKNLGKDSTLGYLSTSDFNNDGFSDIVVSTTGFYYIDTLLGLTIYNKDTSCIYLNDHLGNYVLPTKFYIPSPIDYRYELIVADFNNDNKIDIITSNLSENSQTINKLFTTLNINNSSDVSYYPKEAGTCSFSLINFFGNFITPKMHLKFAGAGLPNIDVPDSNIKYDGNHRISVSVDFSTVTTGKYDIILSDSNGVEKKILNGFELQSPTSSNFEIQIVGPTRVRAQRKTTFLLQVENQSNCISLGVPLVLIISGNTQLNFLDSLKSLSAINIDTLSYFALDNYNNSGQDAKVYQILIDGILPHSNRNIFFTLKPINSGEEISIKAFVNDQYFASPLKEKVKKCYDVLIDKMADNINICRDATNYDYYKSFDDFYEHQKKYFKDKYENNKLHDVTADFKKLYKSCQTGVDIAKSLKGNWIKILANLFFLGAGNLVAFDPPECKEIFDGEGNNDGKDITTINSTDPNDKYGIGFGSFNWVNGKKALTYGVHFENVDTASASAQVVILKDTLDISKVDITTFKPELIIIGNHTIDFTTNKTNQPLLYDMRPAINLIVKIEIILDSLSGEVKVIYTSLDPATMQLTTDPLLGFLPPNINKPDGEGSFYYSVKLKAGLPNNTVINNTANIYFDTNDPILTPTWTNTVDILPPTSRMNAIVPNTNDTTIYLSWSGTDVQSGIQKYDIFYSENGGNFFPYETNFPNDSIQFNGKAGASYSFYTIAIDNVGNRESKTNGEVTAKINEHDVQIFPNPSTGEFTLQTKNDLQVSSISLFDLQGQKMPITYKKINNIFKVQVPHNQIVGNYILKIITADKTISRKITIEK